VVVVASSFVLVFKIVDILGVDKGRDGDSDIVVVPLWLILMFPTEDDDAAVVVSCIWKLCRNNHQIACPMLHHSC
jgi:hypothetical protein